MGAKSDALPALNDKLLRAAKAGVEYRITETGPFLERVAHLHGVDRTRLRARLDASVYPQLRIDPRAGNARKIREGDDGPEQWGYYLGNWTLTYEVDDAAREILITGVAQKESTIIRHR